jgi:hypothetical protein
MKAKSVCHITDQAYAAAVYVAKGHKLKFATVRLYYGGLSVRILEFESARTGFAQETIFMPIRLLNVVCLAALAVFPAYGQGIPAPGEKIAAITTYLQFITEDDVDQRTKLDLLLAQKQVGRERIIGELGIDMDDSVKAEGAGLLSDALVDRAFADMCSRLGVAPADLMKTLEEKGIRLDTLRRRLRSEVARERLAQRQSHDHEDRLDHPLIPKM